MTKPQAVRKRAFAPKARTGCATCKKRKIKCDETKPKCHACTFQNLTCWYESVARPRPPTRNEEPRFVNAIGPPQQVPPRSLPQSAIAALTPTEIRYLEYFHRKILIQVSRPRMDSPGLVDFLSRTALQQCEHSRQTLDAVLSIGALAYSRRSLANTAPMFHHSLSGVLRNEHYCAAIKHYARAVAGVRKLLADDPSTRYRMVLMTSVLFILFEQLQDNSEAVDRLAASTIGFLRGPDSDSLLPGTSCGAPSDPGLEEAKFFIYSNFLHNSMVSPMYPRARQRLKDVPFASPSQMLVAGPQKSLREFVTGWFQFTTMLVGWQLTSTPGLGTFIPISIPQDILSTLEQWKREAERRLSECSGVDRHSTLLMKQIIFSAASIVQGKNNDQPQTTNTDIIPSVAQEEEIQEWISLVENALEDSNPCLDGADSDPLGDRPCLTMIPALLINARDMRHHPTRLKALGLCRRQMGPASPWSLKAIYLGIWAIVQVEGAYQSSQGQDAVDARYHWTEGHWNENYTQLRVTLTEATPTWHGKEPRREYLTLSTRAHGLVL